MKTIRILILFLILFSLITIATSMFQSSFDGNNLLGFPWAFYEYLGGKRNPEPTTRHNINIFALVADLTFIFIISFIADKIIFRNKGSRIN
jgi:hypothetical protein